MTYQEAQDLLNDHLFLVGSNYNDTKRNQIDFVKELVVTPQDHPFFPEFLHHYRDSGSYPEASRRSYETHSNDILYTVKCVLEEIYDMQDGREMHVLMDLKYVLPFVRP